MYCGLVKPEVNTCTDSGINPETSETYGFTRDQRKISTTFG